MKNRARDRETKSWPLWFQNSLSLKSFLKYYCLAQQLCEGFFWWRQKNKNLIKLKRNSVSCNVEKSFTSVINEASGTPQLCWPPLKSPPWTSCLLWSFPICFSLCPPPQHSGDVSVLGHDVRNIQGRWGEGRKEKQVVARGQVAWRSF